MPQHALRELIALAGLAEAETGQIRITGDDPVFPTPYRIAAAGAAAIAAAGYAAAELWRLRSGSQQGVAVDARAAAAALRSSRYLQVDGKTPVGPRDPLSGFYPVRGGRWICIHCNFPHHRNAAMKVLGSPHEREAAMRASASWDGLQLEDAIHAAGGCAGLTRSADEWALHPHAAAVAAQPLLEILRIGDAPPSRYRPARGRSQACAYSTSRACSPDRPARARSPSMAPKCSKSARRTCPIPALTNSTPASANARRI